MGDSGAQSPNTESPKEIHILDSPAASEQTNPGAPPTSLRVAVEIRAVAFLPGNSSSAGVPIRERRGPQVVMNRRSGTLNTNPPQRGLIDIAALADRLGVSERFVRRLVAERRLPFFKVGKFIRFDSNDIDRWIATRRVD